jgi:hypothetical protein
MRTSFLLAAGFALATPALAPFAWAQPAFPPASSSQPAPDQDQPGPPGLGIPPVHKHHTGVVPDDKGPDTPQANAAYNGGGVILQGAPGAPAPQPQALPPATPPQDTPPR